MLYRFPFDVYFSVISFLDVNQQLALACVNSESTVRYANSNELTRQFDQHWSAAFEVFKCIRALTFQARRMALFNYRVDAFLRLSLCAIGVAGVVYNFCIDEPMVFHLGISYALVILAVSPRPVYLPYNKEDFMDIKQDMRSVWSEFDTALNLWGDFLRTNDGILSRYYIERSTTSLQQFQFDIEEMIDQVGTVPNNRCHIGAVKW